MGWGWQQGYEQVYKLECGCIRLGECHSKQDWRVTVTLGLAAEIRVGARMEVAMSGSGTATGSWTATESGNESGIGRGSEVGEKGSSTLHMPGQSTVPS